MQAIERDVLVQVTGGCQCGQQQAPQQQPAEAAPAGADQGAAASGGNAMGGIQQLLGFFQSDGFKQLLGGLQSMIGGGQQPAAGAAPQSAS